MMTDYMATCPYCKTDDCEAEWVDIGVGLQQVAPYYCHKCEAMQIGPYDKPESVSEEERSVGWYLPRQ